MTDANEATRCEFISAILHASIAIAKNLTSQDIFIVLQKDISGEDATGRVDYTIKSLEEFLCITEGKPRNIKIGYAQIMSSELEVLKQRITELEAENAELRKENTEIRDLRIKLSVSDAEIAELKRRNNEFLRANAEYNERRDAENAKLRAENVEFRDRLTKVEQKQTLQSALTANDNSSNNSSPSFNSVAVPEAITVPTNSAKYLNGKLLEEKDMDSFLLEAHKKIVSSEIKQRNKEKKLQAQESLPTHPEEKVPQELNSCNRSHKKKGMDELKHELFNPPSETDSPLSINHNIMTEVSEMACPEKFTCDSIDEASHHLAQLCDKAIDAEDRANRANQEEILCWCLYWKDFRNQLDELIRSGGGKFGEKKARSILYDTITEQLSILRKKRSQELGYNLGIANSISELTDAQFQEIIDYGISLEKLPPEAGHVSKISETARPEKILPTSEENSAEEEEWFDEDTFFNEANPTKVNTIISNDDMYFNETNDANTHNGDSNSCNEDSDPDSNSEDEMPDDSDDDGYDRYGGYNEYGECDRGYYYRDGRYERKTSPMMSPIISPVTA
ncbi:hypothetical protein RclHR1_17790010 [Rhizophagus clarus]|uniref:Uncharacterized protein n=1 Tax=Rhizophagus clarus TaxID=94130 RepID=A0A2Z6R187_9GLOM|nr:hypothetical protein RclHR1_17790010 [Rhizophagus clarus]